MKKLLFGLCWMAAACAGTMGAEISEGLTERRMTRGIDLGTEEVSSLAESQNVHFSSYGGNERRFEVSEMRDFIFPLEWLNAPRSLEGKIYLVKQVGKASIFCLVKPNEVKLPGAKKASAEYSVYLIKQVSAEPVGSWEEFLRGRFGERFKNFRVLELDKYTAIQVHWNDAQYADAPVVFTEQAGRVYEVVLLYCGLSRRYADELLNKFPWRIFANN